MNTNHPIMNNILALSDRATWNHTLDVGESTLSAWLEQFDASKVERVYFVGCGTSYYAGQVGKYIVERIAHIPAEAVQAFAFATYAQPDVLGAHALVAGISTTGGSEAVVDALAHAQASGAATLAITANAGSAVSDVAQATILTGGGDDKVSVKTKSYVQSLVTLYLLSLRLANTGEGNIVPADLDWSQQIERASEGVMRVLDETQPVMQQLAEQYAGAGNVFVLGTGPNCGTAEEASLKVIEMAKVFSEAQELEDFLHGRFREVDQVNPMFFLAPHGRASARILDFLAATNHVGAPSIVLTDHVSPGIERLATHTIIMPGDVDEFATPLLYIVPMYLFSYHLALYRGFDPAARRYDFVPQKMRYVDVVSD